LLESIRQSNDLHKNWPRRKLESVLGRLEGKTIAVLGLTYKPGTSTLRRSAAIELCRWLCEQRACVRAFDPAVTGLSDDLKLRVALCGSAIEAATDADAALVLTEWPVFRELRAADLVRKMRRPVLVDANRFLEKSLPAGPPLRYITVGAPEETE
jgi:UDPglucose 6-dehydrogenase